MNFIAKTFHGLEEVLAKELELLKASNITIGRRSVTFSGDKQLLYTANLWLRSALKIFVPIEKFNATREKQLYQNAYDIKWENYLKPDSTIAIDSTVYSDYFNHSHYVALKVKDAIVDRFREIYGKRPSIDTKKPDVRIQVHVAHHKVTISLDSSGDSLHKRGYHFFKGPAPLNEVLAAGLVLLSGWDKKSNLLDPMCGSGTILTEATFCAYNIPACIHRKYFGFMGWKDYDEKLWEIILKEVETKQTPFEHQIIGSDISAISIKAAKKNIEYAELANKITLTQKAFEDQEVMESSTTIITNPPYGEQIVLKDLNALYKSIGDTLKHKFTNGTAWILSSNKAALKNVGLRTSAKKMLFNGPLECKLHKYEMYSGSRKAKYD